MPPLDQRAIPNVSAAPAKRVLLVEDESLVALMMAEQIVELGYTMVGPACTMSEARHLAAEAPIDGALLDLNLNGVWSHEIADILSRRKIPFAFITGYSEPPSGLYKNIDVLHKPFQRTDLGRVIEGVLAKLPGEGLGGTKQQLAN